MMLTNARHSSTMSLLLSDTRIGEAAMQAVADDDSHNRPKQRRLIALALTALAVLTFFGVVPALVVVATSQERVWYPLGPYPLQEAQQLVDIPAGDPASVTVFGEKCYKEDVFITGTKTWMAISPRGAIVQEAIGEAKRDKGCLDLSFVNPIPGNVLNLTDQLGGEATWIITGTDTPHRDGRYGAPLFWSTTPIVVRTK